MEADWDLHAVVRGCTTTTTTTTTTITSTSSSSSSISVPSFASSGTYYQPPSNIFSVSPNEQASTSLLSLSNTFESKNTFVAARSNCIEELHELCEPFFLKSQPPSLQLQTSSSPISSFSYSSSPKSAPAQQKQHQPSTHASSATTTPRSKRRKNQVKKVCQVAAENLSSDIWAWRKYGQKPIKGSPYPRGYYRCSSSKGCLARKQVERNRTDPTMFIVTYTGEHSHPAPTHRNSLAGSTRQKPQTPQSSTTTADKSLITKEPLSPSATTSSGVVVELEEAASLAPPQISSTEEDLEDLMNDDDDVELENDQSSDMVLTDDFFEGLDELTGSSVAAAATEEDCFSDPFVSFPSWVANNNAATAAGGSS